VCDAELNSERIYAKGTLFEEWVCSHSSTPYVEVSSLVGFGGFNPAESPSRIARSCIKDDRSFAELLEFHPDVGTFVVSHGGRDHEILSSWVGYRRLLTHCLLDEGVRIEYPNPDWSEVCESTMSRSELAQNFKVDAVFRLGMCGSKDEPLDPREYFHLFVHDCGHFLLHGFYEPRTDFELFRLAWLGAEHYARWFSDYEVLKRVAESPYWKNWPPYTDWEEVPEEQQEALFAELGVNDGDELSFYRHHTLYEIIRDAGIRNQIEGRDFLLRVNTNPDYAGEIDLWREIAAQYGLNSDHGESLGEQFRRNVQDEAYIADVYDEVNGNDYLGRDLEAPPEVKIRGNAAFERLVKNRLNENGELDMSDEEMDEYYEPSHTTLESFDSFTDREFFNKRFADASPRQREQVWDYLSRCGAVMKYLMKR
jgi:hypothetical protein